MQNNSISNLEGFILFLILIVRKMAVASLPVRLIHNANVQCVMCFFQTALSVANSDELLTLQCMTFQAQNGNTILSSGKHLRGLIMLLN